MRRILRAASETASGGPRRRRRSWKFEVAVFLVRGVQDRPIYVVAGGMASILAYLFVIAELIVRRFA